MSSCLARGIFCASSRSTPASTTRLGHIRACASNSLCLDCPRLTVGSWHSQSSMACITTTEGRRDAARAVWMEKVASTGRQRPEPRLGARLHRTNLEPELRAHLEIVGDRRDLDGAQGDRHNPPDLRRKRDPDPRRCGYRAETNQQHPPL